MMQTAEEIDPQELLSVCYQQKDKIKDLKGKLAQSEAELRECRERLAKDRAMRPSLEVLQRMANGIDPFDKGRFECAVAALQYETPRLSATMSHLQVGLSLGAKFDQARANRAKELGLVTIEGDRG